ncbi:MAG TPA: potassium transporter Kup, partial [Candidatus Limosilactobacillus merdipullorum]|nr:potassium transporter Kup [Candidatus Limosilactobacillus merdipullorum]
TVNTTDEPYTSYYMVDMMGTRNIVNLQLYLGFKMGNSVNMYLRQVVSDLMSQGVIDKQPQEYTTDPGRVVGDFRFVIIRELLDKNTAITGWRRGLIQIRIWLQNHTVTPVQFYGLEFSDTVVETVPLFLKRRMAKKLRQNVIANKQGHD